MSHMENINQLKIPLQVIKNCTQDFHERNIIGRGGYGKVYKGILIWPDDKQQLAAIKRLDDANGQGNKEFRTEILMHSQYHHENIINMIGYCDDDDEKILVYKYASRGSLDKYLHDGMLDKLSWPIRLNICRGVASAVDYLRNHVGLTHRIIHRDIKSANILLDENWNPKLADFGLSRIGLANEQNTIVITNLAGTYGYCDPQYEKTGVLTKESDVYSLGVVLFELLCGRLACVINYHDERRFLPHLARSFYKRGIMEKIIDSTITEHINPKVLRKFSAIAYKCLQETREERPKVSEVLLELKNALRVQCNCIDEHTESGLSPSAAALLIQISFWSFSLKKNQSSSDAILLIQMSFVSHMTRTSRKCTGVADAILLIQPTFQILKKRRAENHLALVNFSDSITPLLSLFYDNAYPDPLYKEEAIHKSKLQNLIEIFSLIVVFVLYLWVLDATIAYYFYDDEIEQ